MSYSPGPWMRIGVNNPYRLRLGWVAGETRAEGVAIRPLPKDFPQRFLAGGRCYLALPPRHTAERTARKNTRVEGLSPGRLITTARSSVPGATAPLAPVARQWSRERPGSLVTIAWSRPRKKQELRTTPGRSAGHWPSGLFVSTPAACRPPYPMSPGRDHLRNTRSTAENRNTSVGVRQRRYVRRGGRHPAQQVRTPFRCGRDRDLGRRGLSGRVRFGARLGLRVPKARSPRSPLGPCAQKDECCCAPHGPK